MVESGERKADSTRLWNYDGVLALHRTENGKGGILDFRLEAEASRFVAKSSNTKLIMSLHWTRKLVVKPKGWHDF